MKCLGGHVVMLGNKLDLGGGMSGIVVCRLDDGLFEEAFPETDWGD